MRRSLVSVIIPTFNSERFLESCLQSLKRQTWSEVEIIVVDDGSIDKTVEIAEKHGCMVVRNPKSGRSEAKNEGIKRSAGEYLYFVDSDMELNCNVISECVHLAQSNPRFGGIAVPDCSMGDSFWVRVREFERSFYAGSIIDSPRFFPADLVKEVGGFEEGLIFYEESTLPYKISKQKHRTFLSATSETTHHEEGFSLPIWLKKKYCYGKTVHLYNKKYAEYSRQFMSIGFRFSLFMKDRQRFLRKPQLAIGVTLLKSLEYFAATLGQFYSRIAPGT
jgi:glycosyltransferase involved in cell wall biosynthesis